MNCLLTETQIYLKKMVRDFVKKELTWEIVKEYDQKGEVPMHIVQKAIDMGLTTLTVPEEFGGAGLTQMDSAIVTEELAYGDAGFAVTIMVNDLAISPVMLFGNEPQKKYIADKLLDGKLAAFGLTEANAGSDAAACKTKAVKAGDEYILNGTKSFITNGGLANFYTIFAVTDSQKGVNGISCFIVERGMPGFSVGKEEDKMGIRLSNTTELVMEDVHVPAKNLVGKEGEGFKYAMMTLDRTRPASAAACCGMCQSAIDKCIEYAKVRKTFGRPIIKNQAIGFMLADMEIQTQAARALLWHAARIIDSGVADAALGACAKTFGSDTAVKVATDAIQIFGGNGYSKEYPIEIILRNAKIYQIFEGTNQVQRMVIAGALSRK